jgi:hypothetical protein
MNGALPADAPGEAPNGKGVVDDKAPAFVAEEEGGAVDSSDRADRARRCDSRCRAA